MTRSAAEIGAGLAPIRAPRQIVPGERIHIVGAAGAGASAAALLALAAGAAVTGCDVGGPSPYTPAMLARNIHLDWVHDPSHVAGHPQPSRLAVTKALTAVAPDHPELRAALEARIPIEPWQQVVADAALGRRLVAVAGTHGKSTTSGWLVHALAVGGLDPSAFVGALLPGSVTGGTPATARIGSGLPFVVEADEYAGNFDAFVPDVAVVTSIEWDHPDVFEDLAAVQAAFQAWLERMPGSATLVANIGDPGVAALLTSMAPALPCQVVAYALTDASPTRSGFIRGIAGAFTTLRGPAHVLLGRVVQGHRLGTTIELVGLDALAGPQTIELPTAGRHNATNALGVAGAAQALGLDAPTIGLGLSSFPGIGRRLERKGEAGGVVVYDDYGHHPTAIRETVLAVRQREPGRRLWAVYEPLTYHRTAAMLQEFAAALAEADAVGVAEIWAGRDPDTTLTSAGALAAAIGRLVPHKPVSAPGSVDATAAWLADEVVPGDVVLVMGGGRSYRIAELLLERLSMAGF